MLEIGNILAVGAIVLLAISFAAWVNSLGSPLVTLAQDGKMTSDGSQRIAAILLMAAVGVSALAAMLAVGGRLT
jgi:hypothetical protein